MIVLVGFMGAGKSTVGEALASELDVPFVDADSVVAARAGMHIADIFETEGEPAFRALEEQVVCEILSDDGDAVVALGGGALGSAEVRERLQGHTVVHLDVSLNEAMRRIGDSDRPMLRSNDPVELYERRLDAYKHAASLTVEVDARSPSEIANELAHSARTNDRVLVNTPSGSYEVIVGEDVLHEIGVWINPTPRRVVLVHQPTVERYSKEIAGIASGLGAEVTSVEVPDAETGKTPDVARDMWQRLSDLGANRDDVLVTVGGGSVSDLGGFVASTYMRGLRVIHLPTTLLGQVDAAVGGKTAINLSAAKNLVGTIHQPLGVICDVRTLESLPSQELRSGSAEIVKYGLISDPELLEDLTTAAGRLLNLESGIAADLVRRCVRIKAAVVSEDERDSGRRKILNYGHTFGHAFEQHSGFTMRHGEAVSLGMMAAAYTAEALGWLRADAVAAHRDALEALGLPVSGSYRVDDLRAAWMHDKKATNVPRFVLLQGLGRPEIDVEVPEDVLASSLARLSS